jgi:hypothetical protein
MSARTDTSCPPSRRSRLWRGLGDRGQSMSVGERHRRRFVTATYSDQVTAQRALCALVTTGADLGQELVRAGHPLGDALVQVGLERVEDAVARRCRSGRVARLGWRRRRSGARSWDPGRVGARSCRRPGPDRAAREPRRAEPGCVAPAARPAPAAASGWSGPRVRVGVVGIAGDGRRPCSPRRIGCAAMRRTQPARVQKNRRTRRCSTAS